MSKVIINGKEEIPTKKVKLTDHIKRTDVTKIIQEKRKELENESENN
jgi:hypothetical protein